MVTSIHTFEEKDGQSSTRAGEATQTLTEGMCLFETSVIKNAMFNSLQTHDCLVLCCVNEWIVTGSGLLDSKQT